MAQSSGKHKFRVEFDGFLYLIDKLEKAGGDVKKVAEQALIKTHEMVTEAAAEAVQKQNLPAHGIYSRDSGGTRDSLVRTANVEWDGLVASVETGFDIENGGLPTIFMIHGTPKYMKNQKLYNAFYGAKMRTKIREEQEQIFWREIWRLMK